MFPLRDDNPTRRFPILTVGLIVINVIVFLLELDLDPSQRETLVKAMGVVPVRFTHGPGGGDLITLFTSQFLHGSFLHLIGNMLYLWIFGNNIEDYLGRVLFLPFYFVAGAIAAMAQIMIHADSLIPTIGASGAIAGVLGAYLVLFPRAQVHTLVVLIIFIRVVPIPAAWWLGAWFVIQVVAGMTTVGREGGVAWFAHIGGFAFGALAILLLAPRRSKRVMSEFDGIPLR
jgi:membrane associated rhomboid family serine protease